MQTKALAKKIAQLALTKKASDVVVMDLRTLTDMTDFFVICSGDADVQVKAIADAIIDGTSSLGVNAWHREGLSQRQWVLLDYVDIVVHIFVKESREFYNLEKIWGDAKTELVVDKPPRKAAPRNKAVAKKAPARKKAPVKSKTV